MADFCQSKQEDRTYLPQWKAWQCHPAWRALCSGILLPMVAQYTPESEVPFDRNIYNQGVSPLKIKLYRKQETIIFVKTL
ncbi:MAG TPA: hypothetical protein PLQ53_06275 [Saprospiraceae bacterium]|nr:hypothetical protein [Saprospiraceae bacterium]